MLRNLFSTSNKYDPDNKEHQEKIAKQIGSVKAGFAALASVDASIGAAWSLEFYLLTAGWAGSWGPWVSLPIYIATAKVINSAYDRDSKMQEFATARNELFRTYHWCLDSQGMLGTQDPAVIEILRTLQPFVQSRDALIPPGLKACKQEDISLEFKQILAACPQDGERIWPHSGDQTFSDALDGVFKDISLIKAASWVEKSVSTNWAKFFSQAAANSVRLGYGSKFDHVEQQAPQFN